MSRQQTRSSADGAIDPSLVQKKRARHRLVGAICLCLLAAIIVPMVLESEPRPREGELPIEMAAPVREAGEPAATGAVAAATDPAATDAAAGQSGVRAITPPAADHAAAPPPVARQEPGQASAADIAKADIARSDAARVDAAKVEAARAEAAKAEAAKADAAKAGAAKAETARQHAARQDVAKAASAKGEPSQAPPVPEKPAGRSEEPDVLAGLIDRANASDAEGAGGAPAKAVTRKFLIQIGAYSNVQSARSVSDRAVQVGLKPYQETVKTAQGDWIRVRVGPFSTRQDAERAQQDLKRAGVTAAIIVL